MCRVNWYIISEKLTVCLIRVSIQQDQRTNKQPIITSKRGEVDLGLWKGRCLLSVSPTVEIEYVEGVYILIRLNFADVIAGFFMDQQGLITHIKDEESF